MLRVYEFHYKKEKTLRELRILVVLEGVNLWNEISKDGLFKRVSLILENNLENWLYLIAPITKKITSQYCEVAADTSLQKWLLLITLLNKILKNL